MIPIRLNWRKISGRSRHIEVKVSALYLFTLFQPGEGGIILLADAPEDESCTDDFEDAWALSGPPSPCNVEFENANVLIEGKSSFIGKLSKRQKVGRLYQKTHTIN